MTAEVRDILKAECDEGEGCLADPVCPTDPPVLEELGVSTIRDLPYVTQDSSYDFLEDGGANVESSPQEEVKQMKVQVTELLPLKPAPGKGPAGDEPEPSAALGEGAAERTTEMELEKVRMEFELTRLKYLHEENERQRQHEEVMEQLHRQAPPGLFPGGFQDLLLPQNQFAMFLYCFIFIHVIYVTKEMIFFLFTKHYLFCIAAILLCLIKTLWSYVPVPPCSTHLMVYHGNLTFK
ncbi:transmembrane protein 247 isoform X1 [Phascolarctos cinereus]|uniref:Transmembrane protein 247 isoform X1 n=1 Tax=Phascolarctos cinereus TaxID=38626 RepID=A0A6P5LFT6_PHACI|nr:transmembrane protein 247 isoform X1 [Phascolarctos cinereus]